MSNELQVIETDVLTVEEKTTLSTEIDRIIAAHKDNRQDINRLVFESVAAMTTADEAASELSSKGFFRRLIGGLSGDNQRLQNKINSNRAAAQYAYQQTLQRLAEQNLMTFDLITAVNNKLNASMVVVGEEFQRIYEGLGKFLQHNRGELVRLETRLDKVERNVNLLTWQNSIEYQALDGCEYAALDDASKIVCLTRDFYDITKGNWTTSDLLLLKTAMTSIDIRPKDRVNYFSALKEIADSPMLTAKLLGNCEIKPLDDPAYLIAFGTLKKLDSLQGDEAYIVRTITDYLTKSNVASDEEHIRTDLTAEYMRENVGVRLDTEIECYDLILDLLFNLQQAESEDLLKLPASAIEAQLHKAERLHLAYKLDQAFPIFKALAESGNGRAMYFVGEYHANGYYGKINEEEAKKWRERGAQAGDVLAKLNTIYAMPKESEKRKDIIKEALPSLRELSEQGDVFAMNELADIEDDEKEMQRLLELSAQKGYWRSMVRLGKVLYNQGEYEKANEWCQKAGEAGYDWGWNNLGNAYYNGKGVPEDKRTAILYYKKAYKQNGNLVGLAANNIGNTFCNLDEYEKANEWYRKAGEAGYDWGWYNLAESYRIGEGVARDEEKAREYFQRAYDMHGSAEEKSELALRQLNGW
jgi:putative tetratricopeptide repeat-containing domain protein